MPIWGVVAREAPNNKRHTLAVWGDETEHRQDDGDAVRRPCGCRADRQVPYVVGAKGVEGSSEQTEQYY